MGPCYLLPLTHAGDRSLPRVLLQTIGLRTGLFILVTGIPNEMVGFGNVSQWKKPDQMPDQTPGNFLAPICVVFFLCKRRRFSYTKTVWWIHIDVSESSTLNILKHLESPGSVFTEFFQVSFQKLFYIYLICHQKTRK